MLTYISPNQSIYIYFFQHLKIFWILHYIVLGNISHGNKKYKFNITQYFQKSKITNNMQKLKNLQHSPYFLIFSPTLL